MEEVDAVRPSFLYILHSIDNRAWKEGTRPDSGAVKLQPSPIPPGQLRQVVGRTGGRARMRWRQLLLSPVVSSQFLACGNRLGRRASPSRATRRIRASPP
jgi:hypothetical protein